jgi:hypothetical protein
MGRRELDQECKGFKATRDPRLPVHDIEITTMGRLAGFDNHLEELLTNGEQLDGVPICRRKQILRRCQ